MRLLRRLTLTPTSSNVGVISERQQFLSNNFDKISVVDILKDYDKGAIYFNPFSFPSFK